MEILCCLLHLLCLIVGVIPLVMDSPESIAGAIFGLILLLCSLSIAAAGFLDV